MAERLVLRSPGERGSGADNHAHGRRSPRGGEPAGRSALGWGARWGGFVAAGDLRTRCERRCINVIAEIARASAISWPGVQPSPFFHKLCDRLDPNLAQPPPQNAMGEGRSAWAWCLTRNAL